MNLTALARRLRVTPEELRHKLPELGFSLGRKAIKVDNRVAQQIMEAWGELKRRERLQQKMKEQQEREDRRKLRREGAAERPIPMPPIMTVRDFASSLGLPVPRVMQELMRNGILAALNERIDFDTAAIVAEDLGFLAVPEEISAESQVNDEAVDRVLEAFESESKENLTERAPVIVVMGHVDHGKTKLLDAIRSTDVVATESGGITQHIGAYQVERKNRALTFIDTPGHEAFTVMRSRGAKVADIAILVVAADDGVQPQTKEAINIARSAGLPFVVALNKIDRPEANIERVKGELAELKVVPEDWGGDVAMIPISAKEGTGIDELLDVLILIADLEKEHIVANANRKAIGTVIESHVNEGEGPVATVLVQAGTLKVGDYIGVRDSLYGRVRAMRDWNGGAVQEAPPSTPVKIIGWKHSPAVGDIMEVPERVKDLKKVKATDISRTATEEVAAIKTILASEDEEGESSKKTLNLIIRTDVLGSLEAILGMLDKVKHDAVGVKVVGKGLGNITETDISHAEATQAIVLAFNTRPTASAEALARDSKVEIRTYSVIYKLFDDVIAELEKLLPSETIVTEIGTLEILANFRKMENGWIVGGKIKTGKIVLGAKARVKRDEEYVGEGEVITLQAGRTEVKEALAGQECGFHLKGRVKPENGDILEFYQEERETRELEIKGISKR